MIKANPATAGIYQEIAGRTLLGLFYISAFSTLFFVFLPAEIPFIYYIMLDYNPVIIISIAVVGNTIGLMADYYMGRLLGQGLMQKLLKEKYEKWMKWVERWGGSMIVFGNAIPFPIEPISVVIGALKYPSKKFLMWSIVGRVIKFILTWFVFIYASHVILPIVTTYLPLNTTIL